MKDVRCRKLKNIDILSFRSDISLCELYDNSFINIDDFACCYDTTLLVMLDK